MLQMHTLVNKGLEKMYHRDFAVTFNEVVDVFKSLHDSGIIKFRTPEDWGKSDAERAKEEEKNGDDKKDGSASQGIPR